MYIRSAVATDLPAIVRLVNDHARRGEVLPRSALSIRDTLNDWLVGEDEAGRIVACVSLLYYSSVLAEVRSLAVLDDVKGQGWGSALVKAIMAQARHRQVPKLFALTRAVPFFEKVGFSITTKERFPEKVWGDCYICPVKHRCDETAVVFQLSETTGVGSFSGKAVTFPSSRNLSVFTIKKEPKMSRISVNKVVLAYSGGLDTSVIVPWLRENYGCEVICFCANIGQEEELSGLEEKGIASGASKVIVEDLRHEFAQDFLFPMMHSGAVYERQYLLGTSVARPLIAKWQVAVAEAEGAEAVAHGCTGKGNDQVRF